MKNKLFGKHTGLYASELVLGGAMFGSTKGYGADKVEVANMLTTFTDHGGNFIDTADFYQNGESEVLIGDFITGKRNEYILSSKFTRGSSERPSITTVGNHRKAMVQSVEQSLKRLKTDRIDIYLAHFDDNVTSADELVRGFDDLVSSGKILYGGLSNYPAWKMASAVTTSNLLGKASIITLQTEFSLVQRVPERELLPMADYFGLGVMGYSPLAGGLLTGKYRKNETGRIQRLKMEAQITDSRNEAILDRLIEISMETGYTPANVAQAWVGAKGIFPVIGPRTKKHLDDYLKSLELILSEDQIKALDQVSELPLGYPHEINKIQRELLLQQS